MHSILKTLNNPKINQVFGKKLSLQKLNWHLFKFTTCNYILISIQFYNFSNQYLYYKCQVIMLGYLLI